MTSESSRSSVAEDVPTWELSILFNGSKEQAEQMLEHLADIARTMNETAAAGVTLLCDLEEWEACRCGR